MLKLRHFFLIALAVSAAVVLLLSALNMLEVTAVPLDIPGAALLISDIGFLVTAVLGKKRSDKQND